MNVSPNLASYVKVLRTPATWKQKPGCAIALLGTAHAGKLSKEQAGQLVREVKPHVVFLELCEERRPLLHPEFEPKPTHDNIWDVVKDGINGKTPPVAGVMAYMASQFAKQSGGPLGYEMREAYNEGVKIRAALVLGDRPIDVTLKRVSEAMTWVEWLKFLVSTTLGNLYMKFFTKSSLEEYIETAREPDGIKNFNLIIKRHAPAVHRALVVERDIYMAEMLSQAYTIEKRNRPNEEEVKIVGIVGAGHLEGIERIWNKMYNIPMKKDEEQD